MAYLNVKDRVLETKIVYYGAGLSGKTTNLEQIKRLANDGRVGEMTSLNTDGDRTLFFDYLPFTLGKFNGCDVKVQLYTVPGQAKYAETRKRVLAGADGVVLVLDSDAGALDRNRQIVIDLQEHMLATGLSNEVCAMLVQLNKRDVPTAMAPGELMAAIGLSDASHVEATAFNGTGVMETLREATRLVLEVIRHKAKRGASVPQAASSQHNAAATYRALVADGLAPPPESAARPSVPPAVRAPAPALAPPTRPSPTAPSPIAPAPAAPPPNAGSEAPPSHLAETIQSVRALSRRLDGLEATVMNHVSTSLAAFERTLVARLADAVAAAADTAFAYQIRAQTEAVTLAVTQSHDGLAAHLAGAATEQRAALERTILDEAGTLRASVAEDHDALIRRVEALASEQGAVRLSVDQLAAQLDRRFGTLGDRITDVVDAVHDGKKRSWFR